MLQDFERTIFEQDRRVVESQRPEQVPFDLAAEMHLKFDAVAINYRTGDARPGSRRTRGYARAGSLTSDRGALRSSGAVASGLLQCRHSDGPIRAVLGVEAIVSESQTSG